MHISTLQFLIPICLYYFTFIPENSYLPFLNVFDNHLNLGTCNIWPIKDTVFITVQQMYI